MLIHKKNRVNIIKLVKDIKDPIKKTKYAACYDVYSAERVILRAHTIVPVKLGISVDMPHNIMCEVRPRSGLTCQGMVCILGTIDPDYKEEIRAIILNATNEDKILEKNTRVAQLFFKQNADIEIFVDNKSVHIDDSIRTGGFGSTGYD